MPQEIWAGLRLEGDPVTHINFFTRNSLAGLFLGNGFDILERRQQVATYGRTALEVLWVLARPAEHGGGSEGDSGASDARGGDASPQRAPARSICLPM